MQRVISPSNPRLRAALLLLASSRERRKSGRCVLEGAHLVAVHQQRLGAPELVIITDEALARNEVRGIVAHVPSGDVIVVPARLLDQHASVPAEVGILAVVPAPRGQLSDNARVTLLLEDIQDPGNVGSILRTAAAAGVDQVLLSEACAFAWSPKVLRAGQGAHFLTTIVEDVDLIDWAGGFAARGGQAVATVARGGASLYTTRLPTPLAVAIGNEGAGLSEALAAQCALRVTIPMARDNESLNAAAAAAIVLFEAVRQRGGTVTR